MLRAIKLLILGTVLAPAVVHASGPASPQRSVTGSLEETTGPVAFSAQPADPEEIVPDDAETVVVPDDAETVVVPDDADTVVVPDDAESVTPPDDTEAVVAPADSSEPVEADTTPIPDEGAAPVSDETQEDAALANADEVRPSLADVLDGIAATMRVSGYMQADYAKHDISIDELSDGTREPLNEDRFLIRRARLRLENDWEHVGFAGETEFFAGGTTAKPVQFDVHAHLAGDDGKPPLLQFKVGLFPVPFTYQNLNQTAFQNFFVERALATDGFIPGRFDLGAAVSGHIWAVDWILAAQNGQPLGADDFSYEDPNSAKDYSGRVQVGGELLGGVYASGGVSFLTGTGFSAGTAPTKDTFEWRDLNEDGRVIQSELIPIPGAAGRASENFDRWGLGGDLRIWTDIPSLGELRLDAELALGENLDRGVAPADPVLLGRDQRGLGFYASITQMFTEHWQAGFRYDQYEPNIDDLELLEGRTLVTRRKFRTFTGGASARLPLSGYARAMMHLEYAYQRNSLGRDDQGKPDNLDNNAMRARFEVVF